MLCPSLTNAVWTSRDAPGTNLYYSIEWTGKPNLEVLFLGINSREIKRFTEKKNV